MTSLRCVKYFIFIIENVNKIELVLNDKVRTQRLAINAYNEMCQYYKPEKIYKILLNIYNKILKQENIL